MEKGNVAMVEKLISAKAKVDAVDCEGLGPGKHPMTAFGVASSAPEA